MDYAQPRLQARYARLGDDGFWAELHAIRDLGPALQTVRGSTLAPWVAGIDATAGPHAIELALRARLRESIRAVESWMPEAWRPAMRWLLRLIDLPALLSLALGATPLPWMASDPELRAYAAAGPETRAVELRRGPLAFLDSVWGQVSRPLPDLATPPAPSPALLAWADEWRRRWPPQSEESLAAMRELERVVRRELARFASEESRGTAALHRELVRRLQTFFRRATLLPAAGFAYLALLTIDTLRLRGELVTRGALGDAGAAA
jgi:hypothetical protein